MYIFILFPKARGKSATNVLNSTMNSFPKMTYFVTSPNIFSLKCITILTIRKYDGKKPGNTMSVDLGF